MVARLIIACKDSLTPSGSNYLEAQFFLVWIFHNGGLTIFRCQYAIIIIALFVFGSYLKGGYVDVNISFPVCS